jgi:hypothetical protein
VGNLKMNEDDRLKPQSKAYAFIALEALSNRFATTLNKYYKSVDRDAMIIPMNIREDDIYYTFVNMKKSKLNGAAISYEYQKDILEHLDFKSEIVDIANLCDAIRINSGKFYGDFIAPKALFEFFKEHGAKKIAIVGANSFARSLYELNCEFELSFFDEYIEDYLTLNMQNADINRISKDDMYDFNSYDILLDFSNMQSLSMIRTFAKINVDIKNSSSILKDRAENYYGYNELLEVLTKEADKFFSKGSDE